jgi:prepilin-type N-terminal cleavage/methylation domain-containing protein
LKSAARSGFTLIEVIIVIVIMAVVMGSAVMSVTAGMRSAAVRDAARTVQQYVRHAKAVALLKQRPVVLQFEEVNENGEFVKSRISLTFSGDAQSGGDQGIGMARGATAADGLARTLSGELVDPEAGMELADAGTETAAAGQASASVDEAQDPLMAEPREFLGVRISARLRDETETTRPRISVFSNVDVLLKKKAAETARAREKEREAKERSLGAVIGSNDDDQKEEEEKDASFSVVYEANGRCEPFVVTVYKDGADEREGLTVNISRFGRPVTED